MEWVETTGKTIEAAREAALDQLGVAADEAEFDVLEEPRPGLFGRMRGEARLRARVRPTQARPKQDRRRRGREKTSSEAPNATADTPAAPTDTDTAAAGDGAPAATPTSPARQPKKRAPRPAKSGGQRNDVQRTNVQGEEPTNMNDELANDAGRDTDDGASTPAVSPAEVGAAAVRFMDGLTAAFGVSGTATLEVDELELDVAVTGDELGVLVGPGGRTLNAIQDLARVAAQRRLGDHDTRLRIDVAGYRARREAALGAFARDVAEQVRSSGTARALEPMASADRKVVHDALNDEPGVASRSVGDDPDRRIVVEPA